MRRRREHKSRCEINDFLIPYARAARRIRAKHGRLKLVLNRQTAPADTACVLQVPAVHVVERIEILVATRDDADSRHLCEPCSQQHQITPCDLARETSHEAALESLVTALRGPWPRVPGA